MNTKNIWAENIFEYVAPYYDKLMKITGIGIEDRIIYELNPGENKILDVGGGTGRISESIKKFQNCGEIYLLDNNKEMLKEAYKRNLENIVYGFSHDMPFSNEFFDMVICVDALHHFESPERSILEMGRVLKPGGKLIIYDFKPESFLTKILTAFEESLGEPGSFLSPEKLEDLLNSSGFEVNIENMYSFQYFLTAVKGDL